MSQDVAVWWYCEQHGMESELLPDASSYCRVSGKLKIVACLRRSEIYRFVVIINIPSSPYGERDLGTKMNLRCDEKRFLIFNVYLRCISIKKPRSNASSTLEWLLNFVSRLQMRLFSPYPPWRSPLGLTEFTPALLVPVNGRACFFYPNERLVFVFVILLRDFPTSGIRSGVTFSDDIMSTNIQPWGRTTENLGRHKNALYQVNTCLNLNTSLFFFTANTKSSLSIIISVAKSCVKRRINYLIFLQEKVQF